MAIAKARADELTNSRRLISSEPKNAPPNTRGPDASCSPSTEHRGQPSPRRGEDPMALSSSSEVGAVFEDMLFLLFYLRGPEGVRALAERSAAVEKLDRDCLIRQLVRGDRKARRTAAATTRGQGLCRQRDTGVRHADSVFVAPPHQKNSRRGETRCAYAERFYSTLLRPDFSWQPAPDPTLLSCDSRATLRGHLVYAAPLRATRSLACGKHTPVRAYPKVASDWHRYITVDPG